MTHEGRVALVTGASGAIGQAIALRLAQAGASLAITGLEPEGTRITAEKLETAGAEVFWMAADLAQRDQTRSFASAALEHFGGRLDIAILNAGMSYKEPVEQVDDARFDHQMEVNFAAPFWLARAAIDPMRAAGGGAIVFISSTGATAAHRNSAVYDAAKAALEALTRNLAVELGDAGIRVNAVQPGHVLNDTDVPSDPTPERLAHWRSIPLQRPGEPDDIAGTVAFLTSADATYLTGTVLRVDGGRTAMSPVMVQPVAPPGIPDAG